LKLRENDMEIENGTSCKLYTFNEYELEQHDKEIRDKVINELLEWADKTSFYDPYFEQNDVEFYVTYSQLKQKLNEMKGY